VPLRFAYADPPYPGKSRKYYRKEGSYAGEVDHAALIAELERRRQSGDLAGWALSTGAYALRQLLPLCPREVFPAAWVKPHGVSSKTRGKHNAWEPLLVVPGRRLAPGRRDWLKAQPARGWGKLPGRKPVAFCAWMFDLLGMLPGDELEDLYPGTGMVTRAWAELGRVHASLVDAARQLELWTPDAPVVQVLDDVSLDEGGLATDAEDGPAQLSLA